MDNNLAQQAVSAALQGNWDSAIKFNLQIVKKDNRNIDAFNRLARAYSEMGEVVKAREYANMVIKLDPFNTIANKSLNRWKGLKKGEVIKRSQLSAGVFLDEPGKTKIVSLINLGDKKLLAKLDSGDEIKITCHSHRVCVITNDGKYIGKFADDMSARLRTLMQAGNEYQAYIKYIDNKEVKIFIRETLRANTMKDTPSFPPEKIDYISFTPPELVHEKKEVGDNISDPDEGDTTG